MAALDLLEQLHARSLDPVAADVPADMFPFALDVRAQIGLAERPHGQRGSLDRPPYSLAILADDRGRMELVGGAGEALQLVEQFVARAGLAEDALVLALEHL